MRLYPYLIPFVTLTALLNVLALLVARLADLEMSPRLAAGEAPY